jgi:DNA-binding transcriptional ArsR family regulator
MLAESGLVKREARGTSVYYSIANPSVYELCELVCGQVSDHMTSEADIKMMFNTPKSI